MNLRIKACIGLVFLVKLPCQCRTAALPVIWC